MIKKYYDPATRPMSKTTHTKGSDQVVKHPSTKADFERIEAARLKRQRKGAKSNGN